MNFGKYRVQCFDKAGNSRDCPAVNTLAALQNWIDKCAVDGYNKAVIYEAKSIQIAL